jgi:hypothetical protein
LFCFTQRSPFRLIPTIHNPSHNICTLTHWYR